LIFTRVVFESKTFVARALASAYTNVVRAVLHHYRTQECVLCWRLYFHGCELRSNTLYTLQSGLQSLSVRLFM